MENIAPTFQLKRKMSKFCYTEIRVQIRVFFAGISVFEALSQAARRPDCELQVSLKSFQSQTYFTRIAECHWLAQHKSAPSETVHG